MATTSPNPTSPPTPTSEIAHLTKILLIALSILGVLILVTPWIHGHFSGEAVPATLEEPVTAAVPEEPVVPESTTPAAPASPTPVAPPLAPAPAAPSQLDRIEGAIVALADKVDGVPTTKWVRGGTFVSRSVAKHASGRYSVWMPEAGGNWLLASEQGKHLAVLLDGKWVNVFLLEDVDRAFSATTN